MRRRAFLALPLLAAVPALPAKGLPFPLAGVARRAAEAHARSVYTTIHLSGEVFDRETVRLLIERINDGLRDSSRVVVV